MVNALSIKNLKKTYKNDVVALKGIDLEVEKGDFFALLGPNGAGKSTTIGIVTSLVNKSSGSVNVFGKNIDTDLEEAKKYIGIVPQEFNFNIFEKVFDIVVQQGGYYGMDRELCKKRAEKYLRKLELWEKRDTISQRLSGGQKRRLMIARALIHEPELLILDEPTAGVDIEIRRTMWKFLKQINKEGKTIILTTHYLEEAEYLCKNIAIIDKGTIIENTSMKKLITRMDKETFILDIKNSLPKNFSVRGVTTEVRDAHTLEVEVPKEESINQVFTLLNKKNIEVISMRNKVNRLEEMFVELTSKK